MIESAIFSENEDDHEDEYNSNLDLVYYSYNGLSDQIEVIGMTPTGYCIAIRVNGNEEAHIPVRGRLPELIQALRDEYERVTGERI